MSVPSPNDLGVSGNPNRMPVRVCEGVYERENRQPGSKIQVAMEKHLEYSG